MLTLPGALPHPGASAATSLLVLLPAGAVATYCLAGLDPGASRWTRRAAPLCFLAGYGYAAALLQMELERGLPDCADADFRTFTLVIESPPEVIGISDRGSNLRFLGIARDISTQPYCAGLGQARVRLTWYSAPPLVAGQIWRVEGKLRPGWSYRNPGGFDYERWLLGQGLHGTGYVKSGELVQGAEPSLLSRLKALLDGWLASHSLSQPGLVRALLLGDDSAIPDDQWQRLRDSGLIHVVVVSGLHVGIVTGLGFYLGLILMRGLPVLTRRTGVRRAAIPFALLVSGVYVLLTGAAVPARRAWLFSAVLLFGLAGSRRFSLPGVFGLVLFIVLVSQPLVVHQQGFWLSFIAVATLLLYFSTRRSGRQFRLVQLIRAQAALCVGLSPALAILQGSIPVTAAFVNLLVVPLISLLVLPGLLAATLLALWLEQPAALALWLVDQLLVVADRVAALAAGVPSLKAVPPAGWPMLWPLCATLLLLCALPPRWLPPVTAAWLMWLAQAPAHPQSGTFRITAFDVGQGSAILVQTNRHNLLFDTGPVFHGGFNLGEVAVLPGLANLGVAELDSLVVSHADTDHSGGLEAILNALPVRLVWASFPLDGDDAAAGAGQGKLGTPALCSAGVSWRWDDVDFAFLHPGSESDLSDNDRSCVLQIQAGRRRAILAGDISRRVESRLLGRGLEPVDLLMAPHHGSRSSSSSSWVSRLAPQIVFVSAPRRSRFGHPHPEVVSRYQSVGAEVYVTGWSGALSWSSASPGQVRQLRIDEPAYWRAPVRAPLMRESSSR